MNLKLIRSAVSVFTLLDEEKTPRVVFTTQRDNRVDDKICLELAGIAFDITNPLRPVIPIDTHPNCRCYYVDESTGEIVTDISSKRIKERGMPSKKLNDIERVEELTEHRKYLTEKKIDLLQDTYEKQKKYVTDKQFEKYEWQFDLEKKASLEQLSKWLRQI